ncbi:MAG TPA: N-acetylglucosamine-6-phosphate deacetylase [Clostridiaceae bacterium]
MIINNCKLVYLDKVECGSLLIKNNIIEKINPKMYEDEIIIDGGGRFLSPGFIDIHTHGAAGYDVMEGSYQSLNSVSLTLASHGITSFLPTLVPSTIPLIVKALEGIKKAMGKTLGANILGANFESPFVNIAMAGALDINYLLPPTIDNIKNIIDDYASIITSMTIAPELEGAMELIAYLTKIGIKASLGHTNANYNEAILGIEKGISHSTHLYNAMKGLHHREPGTVGAIFDTHISCELICDGIHVSYPSIRIALKQKTTDEIILISDSMMATCMGEGEYSLGGLKVYVKNGSARLENGTLAGSLLTLDKSISNLLLNTSLKLPELIKMATYNPAIFCGVANKKGLIKEGYDGDLILFDEAINIHKVIIGGNIIENNIETF